MLGYTNEQLQEIRITARIEEAKRFAAQKDILAWGRALFPEKFTLPFCQELHGYFVDIRGEAFTNTEAPRGHSKTTIKCFLIPLFQALNEPETFRHYLNVQATDTKALAVNRTIKNEIETNPMIRAICGDQMGERWTDQQFVLANGVIFTSVSTGQSIRGINYLNIRPDYIIIDDLYDEEDIYNPDSTVKKNKWFWSTLYSARAKSKRCSLHVQGTAISKEDLLEELKRHEDVKSRTFKAIQDDDSILWIELNTRESLESDRRKMGETIFMREMQNERLDDSTSIVKRSWLTNWEYDPIELEQRLRPGNTIYIADIRIGNDPSIGKKVENDFTGTALIIKTQWFHEEGNDYWIAGLWNEKLSLQERKEQLKAIAAAQTKDRPVRAVRIEAIAGFSDYADEVIRTTNLPVQRIEWVKDKISTLDSKSHYFQNGKVHLNKNIDPKLKALLVDQLTINHPRHDDLRDAVLLCLDEENPGW